MSVTPLLAQARDRRLGLPVVLLLGVYLFALMGRYTLDRAGFDEWGALDLRLVVGPALLVAVLLWRCRPDAPPLRHAWPVPMLWALALFGYLAMTAFWAPFGAEVADRLTDLVALGLLVVVVGVLSGPDPARARRVLLWAMLGAAVVYAVPGLVLGETNVQGRTAAFGGGPNVYVRVVGLGVIAAIGLAVAYRRRLLLAPVPVLVAAALFTGSRGGIMALAATGALVAVYHRRRLSARAVVVAVLAAAAVVTATVVLLDPSTTAVLQERYVNDIFVDDQFSGRPQLFDQSLQLFADHPLVGGGLDAFYATYGVSEDLGYPHNLVLEVAATGGLVGLALLAGFATSVVVAVRRLRGQLTADRVAMLAAAAFVAIASMTSGDLYDTRFLWIFVVLAVNVPFRSACPGVVPPDQPAR